jgi:hypothetical protein
MESSRKKAYKHPKGGDMETSCDNCVDGNKNTGRTKCTRGNCGLGYNKFRPIKPKEVIMEKGCKNCKYNIGCSPIKRRCDTEYSGWEPIEPKHSADDYEILRDCTLESLVDDGKCFDAVKFYRKHKALYGATPEDKKRVLFQLFKESDREKAISYLTDTSLPKGAYLKKKERKPDVGDVWEKIDHGCERYIIIAFEKANPFPYTCFNLNYFSIEKFHFNSRNQWKYIGKLKDMI